MRSHRHRACRHGVGKTQVAFTYMYSSFRNRPQKAQMINMAYVFGQAVQTGHSETVRDSSDSRAQSARIT